MNGSEQIVNGTKALIESLLWIDKSVQRQMEKLIRDAIKRSDTEIFLDAPPNYVMMSLINKKLPNQDPITPFLKILICFKMKTVTW